MRDKIIRILWHDSMPIERALKHDLSNTQGLYYITYFDRDNDFKEVSLYLGMAAHNNTIRHRLRAHFDHWLTEYPGSIMVRIGQIVYPRTVDSDTIYDAESAILYDPSHQHLFPENVGKRKSYSYSELYRVENTGDYFELSPAIRMHEQ